MEIVRTADFHLLNFEGTKYKFFGCSSLLERDEREVICTVPEKSGEVSNISVDLTTMRRKKLISEKINKS